VPETTIGGAKETPPAHPTPVIQALVVFNHSVVYCAEKQQVGPVCVVHKKSSGYNPLPLSLA